MWISCEFTVLRDGQMQRTIIGAEVQPAIKDVLTSEGEVLQGRQRQIAVYCLLRAYSEQMLELIPARGGDLCL